MSTAQQVLSYLESKHGLSSKGNGKYRSRSPLRAGSDSDSFSLFIHDDEHGCWKDHVSEEKGSLYDLAKRLDIQTPTHAPDKRQASKTYRGLADYAVAHGVEVAAFEDFHWRDTVIQGKPALAFPTKTGTRYRMLAGEGKFRSPNGYQSCWYGLNIRVMQRVVSGQPLVYSNGEPSTVVAQHFGLAAVTVAGGGERPIPTPLLDELQTWLGDCKPEIIIALDCDPKGVTAALQIQEQFTTLGFQVTAVNLNLWEKGDLADFCKLHQAESLEALRLLPPLMPTEETSTSYQRWRIMPEDEMWGLPPLRFLLEPFIPDGMVGVLFGQSNIGKSFVSLDWALQLSRQYPVMYIIAEGFEGYPSRIAAWRHHHNVPHSDMTYIKGGVRILEDEDFNALLPVLEKRKPKFLVIDTVKKTIVGRNSSDEKDAGLYIDRCYEIKERIGCSVLLVHHTNKGGAKMHGSYSWTTDVDFVIAAYEDDGLLALKADKDRHNPKGAVHYRQIIPVQVNKNGITHNGAVAIPVEQPQQTADDPLTIKQQTVIEAIGLAVYRESFTPADLASYFGDDMSYRYIMKVLSKLKEFGFIQQPKPRAPYSLTPKGYDHLGLICPLGTGDAVDLSDVIEHIEGTKGILGILGTYNQPDSTIIGKNGDFDPKTANPAKSTPLGEPIGTLTASSQATAEGITDTPKKPPELPGFEEVETRKPPSHYDLGL